MIPKEQLILVSHFCSLHDLDSGFITELCHYELLELITIEEEDYLDPVSLPELERMMRMHRELGINVAGIEAIAHLLTKIDTLQARILHLQNRLSRYE